MKKLLFILAASAAIGASAQSNIQWEGVAGLNVSNLGGLGSKPGFHVGAKAEMGIPSIADGVYANAGALLSLEGCKQDMGELGKSKTKANFLDIPIHLGYKYAINDKVSVFGEVGPYFAIGLFGKSEEVFIEGLGQDMEQTTTKVNTFDTMKRFDVGAGLKFGIEFNRKYSLAIGYDWGFINLYDKKANADTGDFGESGFDEDYTLDLTPSIKSKNLSVSIGYKF